MKEVLINYIKEEIVGDPLFALEADDDILNSGIIDSIGIMKLITFIENELDVSVPPEEMVIENFISVDAIENYLRALQQA